MIPGVHSLPGSEIPSNALTPLKKPFCFFLILKTSPLRPRRRFTNSRKQKGERRSECAGNQISQTEENGLIPAPRRDTERALWRDAVHRGLLIESARPLGNNTTRLIHWEKREKSIIDPHLVEAENAPPAGLNRGCFVPGVGGRVLRVWGEVREGRTTPTAGVLQWSHTRAHAHTHTYTHAHAHTHTQRDTRTHKHTHARVQAHTHTHTHTHKRTHTPAQVQYFIVSDT